MKKRKVFRKKRRHQRYEQSFRTGSQETRHPYNLDSHCWEGEAEGAEGGKRESRGEKQETESMPADLCCQKKKKTRVQNASKATQRHKLRIKKMSTKKSHS